MTNEPKVGRYFDDEEKELIETLESDDAVFVDRLTPEWKAELEQMARDYMADKREKITIRIPKRDLTRIKSKALQEGMPYQTLISSILHKAVSREHLDMPYFVHTYNANGVSLE